MSIYENRYVPPYQEEYGKLPWCDRDTVSCINYLKYKLMKNNPDDYF